MEGGTSRRKHRPWSSMLIPGTALNHLSSSPAAVAQEGLLALASTRSEVRSAHVAIGNIPAVPADSSQLGHGRQLGLELPHEGGDPELPVEGAGALHREIETPLQGGRLCSRSNGSLLAAWTETRFTAASPCHPSKAAANRLACS
eukprot:1943290-Rhodomonas_salina.1